MRFPFHPIMPEILSKKKQRWNAIERELEKLYPQPKVGLEFEDPFELTIATILSAQCTDARVNMVTQKLFKKYKKPQDYLRVPAKELEKDIHSTGFYKNKAKNIRGCCQRLIDHFKGKVPQTMEELISLPGVGRKTANIVLWGGFGKLEGIAVDTHVFRVARRLGLANGNSPEKVEQELMAFVDRPKWGDFTNVLIWHGRKVCDARKPRCSGCVLLKNKLCPQVGVTAHA